MSNTASVTIESNCISFYYIILSTAVYVMMNTYVYFIGHNGYRVYKSVPYGPVWETLPYLARRAQENKAILANSRRERKLVTRALADRIMLKK